MTKKLSYLIKFTYDKTYEGYVADVVNLYGCMSQGKTKKEAMINVKRAIGAYMEAVKKTETKKDLVKEVINIPISFACASV